MGINEYIKIGNRIRQLRLEKGYSQKEMAALAGISYTTYSNYENNNREPSMKQIEKIAAALNMTTDDLLGHTDKFSIPLSCVDNENHHLFQLLSEKDSLCTRQQDLDKNYTRETATEEERLAYAVNADMIQYQLGQTLSDIYDLCKVIKEKNNNQPSLAYQILFELSKLNPEGEKRILEEIQILSHSPEFKVARKPEDWDPYDDIYDA